ncbi:histidine phosphatase family protein [Burkholderia pseudomultivorans]|uniref:histidine phosphatase family protein n=1 Tax=Burkholderia pseudomultivorans TaxID=1207504 RepID=UPI0001FDA82E|nr:histidine phosphatase family protein [Burkholderia pseudomultivorans]AOI92864.1 fructose-2,6-bisphosphatase [Burkholderia pseudomultivorans]EGD02396.1 phosphoglycerate mutase family protein [Burkholderia sp. TJI49]KVC16659.1 fructose-2,6-bisphosphatase [Burkholderia pseudomultivorans]KVC35156.1 fructose-2,6-bisphosphatase [Burkholderia pseudomultivorans]
MPAFDLPRRRRLYLMRHGDVTYFDDSGRAIDPDTVPLNARGREQASAAGRVFAAQQIRFDRVIASGLPRTIETAQRVLAETGQRIDIEIEPAWREIRGGHLADIPPEQHRDAFLRVLDGIVPESTRFLGGETIGELIDRVLPPLDALRADRTWDTALLVLHGGVNCALLSHATVPGQRLFIGHLSQETGCINALDVGDAPHDWVIRLLNYSPPAALHRDTRNTTMDVLYHQYLQSVRR